MREKKEKLGRIVGFRLSAEDHAIYLAKVAASGKNPSVYFRDCVLSNATQLVLDGNALSTGEMERRSRAAAMLLTRKRPAIKNETMQQLLYVFNKAGNNINQIARRANADHLQGKLSEESYIDILCHLQQIQMFMRAAL